MCVFYGIDDSHAQGPLASCDHGPGRPGGATPLSGPLLQADPFPAQDTARGTQDALVAHADADKEVWLFLEVPPAPACAPGRRMLFSVRVFIYVPDAFRCIRGFSFTCTIHLHYRQGFA